MATIKEMENKMTLFYSKSTGEIKNYCTGIQSMDFFGVDKKDYSLIWDFLLLENDNYILTNINNFIVQDGEVKIKKDVNNYNLAE